MRAKHKFIWITFAALLAPLAMGGCDLSCTCNGDKPTDIVDEIGDEVEDAIDEVSPDN